MAESTLVRDRQACFQLKTSFLPCTTLQIVHYDLDQLAAQLEATIQKAPTFFIGSPIVVDLDGVQDLSGVDFVRMKQILVQSNMVPLGVRGGTEQQRFAAAMAGLPSITMNKSMSNTTPETAAENTAQPKPQVTPQTTSTATQKTKPAATKPNAVITASKVITTPIRSGMQVYAKDADLIVLSSVSAGAELLADGHIHVYGALRGRALAGVQGNTEARIFCRTLEAELVAIAGYYLVKDDIHVPTESAGGMVQVFLEKEQVKIDAL